MMRRRMCAASYLLLELLSLSPRQITKRDVATLISRADISLARSKVEKLIGDDKFSGLLERMEFYCSLLQEKSAELGQPM